MILIYDINSYSIIKENSIVVILSEKFVIKYRYNNITKQLRGNKISSILK